jgi:uncharacterized membrane protein
MMTASQVFAVVSTSVLPALMAWGVPALSRPHTFFGVTAPTSFQSEPGGRRLLRRYRLRVLALSLIGAALAVLGTQSGGAPWLLIAAVVQGGGLVWALARANAETRVHAVPPSTAREASLEPRRPRHFGMLLVLGPYLMLAAAALLLTWRWGSIPERFPIHWGFDGQPNGWSQRTPLGVFAPLALGTAICVLLAAMMRLVEHSGRMYAPETHAFLATVVLAVTYLLATVFSLVALVTAFQWSHAMQIIPAIVLVVAAGLTLYAARGVTALPTASVAGPGDGTADACWKWGLFYCNAEDAALFVPRRIGLGYDLNFGHRAAWWCLTLTLLLPAVVLSIVLASR